MTFSIGIVNVIMIIIVNLVEMSQNIIQLEVLMSMKLIYMSDEVKIKMNNDPNFESKVLKMMENINAESLVTHSITSIDIEKLSMSSVKSNNGIVTRSGSSMEGKIENASNINENKIMNLLDVALRDIKSNDVAVINISMPKGSNGIIRKIAKRASAIESIRIITQDFRISSKV